MVKARTICSAMLNVLRWGRGPHVPLMVCNESPRSSMAKYSKCAALPYAKSLGIAVWPRRSRRTKLS